MEVWHSSHIEPARTSSPTFRRVRISPSSPRPSAIRANMSAATRVPMRPGTHLPHASPWVIAM